MASQPLLGQYHLEISAVGAPKHMQLRVMLDGVPVTEQDLTLAYRGDRPNGPALRESSAGEHRDMSIDRESVALVSAGLVAHAGRLRRRANMAQALALGPRAPVEPPLV